MTKPKPQAIPDGYRIDAQGRLVPLETIKESDLLRDELVRQLIEEAQGVHQGLTEFKAAAFAKIEAFLEASAKRFKVKPRGSKGNFTLQSFDGRYQVKVQTQDRITFNEALGHAKKLIDACIRQWSEGADPKIQALVNDAFEVDREGQVRVGKILSLRRLAIDDAKWKRAMDAIGESITVTGSKSYVRFYERDETGEYKPLSLDLAAL